MEESIKEYLSPRFRWKYSAPDAELCANLALLVNVPKALAEVLFKRGCTTQEEVEEYFNTPLSTLLNPFLMKDMSKGAERICKAIKSKELICIFGDYDVDGVTSTSLMYLFLKELNASVIHYIPNRLEEGYGLNADAIEELAGKGVKLLVTVDCGVSSMVEVALAKTLGMDVVITDHHQPAETLPDAFAVINPMRADDEYPFKYLAGVGVAFKLCIAIRHILRADESWQDELPNLKKYMDIVTLGTIADVVPLKGENRTIVTHGLKSISTSCRVGIDELKLVAGFPKQKLSSSHIGFGLAPRINAVGRLGDSDRGLRLLTTTSRDDARKLAMELDRENKFRQEIEREILAEVFDHIETEKLPSRYNGFVLHSTKWHPGVLGIVASRVADKYCRPTIILTSENGVLKGSARSIPKFHLYNGLKEISDLLLSFGGHKYAAGLKVSNDNINELQRRFNELVSSTLTAEDYIPEITLDAFLEPHDINKSFMTTLQSFEPYGNGNKEPLFCMTGVEKYQEVTFVGKDSSHAKGYFMKDGVNFEAIGYDMRCYENHFRDNFIFDLVFTLSYNSYSRDNTLQLILKDIRPSNKN